MKSTISKIFTLLSLTAAGLLSSCALKTSTPSLTLGTTGSCLASSKNSCTDEAPGDSGASQIDQSVCTLSIGVVPGGTYSASACSLDNLVGSCTETGGSIVRFYSTGSPPYTLGEGAAWCDSIAGKFSAPSSNASGPIDGTWKVSNITCNGAAGNASVQATYSGTTVESFSIYNTNGTYNNTQNGCATYSPATFAYSGSTVTMTISGTMYCIPATCNGACFQTVSAGPYIYTYGVSGSTLTWTSQGTSDDTCTTASPVQSNPVGYTLSTQ